MGGGSCMVLRLRWMQKLAMPHKITKKCCDKHLEEKKEEEKNYDIKMFFWGGNIVQQQSELQTNCYNKLN